MFGMWETQALPVAREALYARITRHDLPYKSVGLVELDPRYVDLKARREPRPPTPRPPAVRRALPVVR